MNFAREQQNWVESFTKYIYKKKKKKKKKKKNNAINTA